MSVTVKSKIETILQEEKWTRAPLSSYTEATINKLHELVDSAEIEHTPTILSICEEHLQQNKNSIPALYIGGVLSIRHHKEDDGYLVKLIKLLFDNQRKALVEIIMKLNSNLYNSEFALRMLATILEERNATEELMQIREMITAVDPSETDLLIRIAQEKERNRDKEGAINDLKNLIHRLLLKKQFSKIRDTWLHLIRLVPKDIEFFYLTLEKVSELLSTERALQLMELYYPTIEGNFSYDEITQYNKKMLFLDPSNVQARNRLVDVYRKKYSENKNLEKFISDAQILGDWRDIHEAIADFERHIAFAEGNFVFHKSWGVGIVRGISSNGLTLDFPKKRKHVMSFHMASKALELLSKDHIKVLKSLVKPQVLITRVKKNPLWTLEVILKSYGGKVDLKTIRAELVPSVLSSKEWANWGTKARSLLNSDTRFGVSAESSDMYVLKEAPSSQIDHTLGRFHSYTRFDDRVSVLEQHIQTEDTTLSKESIEVIVPMLEYFAKYTKQEPVNAESIASSLLLSQYATVLQDNMVDFRTTDDLLTSLDDIFPVFSDLKSTGMKKKLLTILLSDANLKDEKIYSLFPSFISRDFLRILEEQRGKERVQGLYEYLLQNSVDLRFPFIWLARTLKIDETFDDFEISLSDTFLATLNLLILSHREITSDINLGLNRKILKYGQDFLYDSGNLARFFSSNDWTTVHPVYTLIQTNSPFSARITVELAQLVTKTHKDLATTHQVLQEAAPKAQSLIATKASIEEKRALLLQYTEVDIPRISKEIEKARSFGDLKENAEYKAAKEQQANISARIKTLSSELQQVVAFSPSEKKPNTIQFGTTVTLEHTEKAEKKSSVEYTILGPWESNPEMNIISYLSPLGTQLTSLKINDTLTLTIDSEEINYRVSSIEAVSDLK